MLLEDYDEVYLLLLYNPSYKKLLGGIECVKGRWGATRHHYTLKLWYAIDML